MLRGAGIVLLTFAVLLSGCAQAAQKAVEQATGVQTSQKGDTVTVKGKDGESVVVSSTTLEEFKSFPVPEGFKLESSGSVSSKGEKLSVATWKGKGSLPEVDKFYQKTMPGQGWTEESVFTTDTGSMLSFNKGDINVVITTSKQDDVVDIAVMLGKSAQQPAAATPKQTTGSSSAMATPTPAKPEPTQKPEATPTPAGPTLTDASALPAELKDLPVPSGFSLVKDSAVRMAAGGKFQTAVAKWFGKTSVKEVGQFYQKALPGKGWTEEQFAEGEDNIGGSYRNEKAKMMLVLLVEKTDAGTEILMEVVAQEG